MRFYLLLSDEHQYQFDGDSASVVGSVPIPDPLLELVMWWLNAGVAPVYGEYVLALRVGDAVMRTPVDLRKWLPGDAVYEGSCSCLRKFRRGHGASQ